MGYEHVEGHWEVFHPDSGSFSTLTTTIIYFHICGEQCNEGVKTDRHSFWSSEEGQFSGLRSRLHTWTHAATTSLNLIKGSSKVL